MSTPTGGADSPALPEATESTDVHDEDSARIEAFGRAYARWLKACAQIERPDSEDEQFVRATLPKSERLCESSSSCQPPVQRLSGPNLPPLRWISSKSRSLGQRRTPSCCSALARSRPT
jgi:hypothetical protein